MNSCTDNKNICVVHLVRKCNGLDPFNQFIFSYRKYDAGTPHTLLLLFKGFDNDHDIAEYEAMVKDVKYKKIFVDDTGFDIGSYMCAFNIYKSDYKYFCFLNSYSQIQVSQWLVKLHKNIMNPDVGLVGACGSTQSIYSEQSFRNTNFTHMRKIYMRLIRVTLVGIHIFISRCIFIFLYDPYPNYHVRSNAFMINSETLENIHYRKIKRKMDALRFESGKKSLTKQVLKLGLKIIVVDHNGMPYEKEDWHKSNTFWQSNQENLLVSDNQTRSYQYGDDAFRNYLSRLAWRHEARPCLNNNIL